jgi:hypothetical protein
MNRAVFVSLPARITNVYKPALYKETFKTSFTFGFSLFQIPFPLASKISMKSALNVLFQKIKSFAGVG